MSLFDELKALGVNVDDALDRFVQNASLYERMLGSFTSMMKKMSVQPDFDCSDYDEITEKAHAIKGTTGNLSLSPLYEAYTEIVSLLRAGQPEQAKELLIKILPVQNEIIACIEKYM